MVRAVVGTLIEVGLEKVSIDDLKNILASRDRSQAGYSVPAHGLYLINVSYPKHIFAV
jgi:tRNA pseudouridine38-40 synthase